MSGTLDRVIFGSRTEPLIVSMLNLSGNVALTQTAALRPDIVLMDIDMPGEDGIATTRRLKAAFDPYAILEPCRMFAEF